MTVSQTIAEKPENQLVSKNAMTELIDLCKENYLGKKEPYKFEQSLKEFSDDFLRTQKPFGHYEINNRSVFLVNEGCISDDQRNSFTKVRSMRTGTPGVYALGVGKVVNIPTTREPVFEAVRRDHDEN